MSKPLIIKPSTELDNSLMVTGDAHLGNIVLVDRVTGKKWVVFIENGKVTTEPYDKDERRDYRIGKVLGD